MESELRVYKDRVNYGDDDGVCEKIMMLTVEQKKKKNSGKKRPGVNTDVPWSCIRRKKLA